MTYENIKKNYLELVTILLPVKDFHNFLNESIYSILNQSYVNFELIVIDDSEDNLILDLIKTYDDKRITYLKGNRAGLSNALNLGLEQSSGIFIARMDSDDVSHKKRIEEQYYFMKQNNIDICGCNSIIIDENNNSIDTFIAPKSKNLIIPYLVSFVPFFHGSVMINKNFIDKYLLTYSENFYAEDKRLWINFFINKAKFSNIDSFLYYYRENKNSLINSNIKWKFYY